MKPAPPLAPAQNGNFQIAPKPIAEPALARMNPIRELHCALLVMMSIFLDKFVFSSLKSDQGSKGKRVIKGVQNTS